MTELIKRGKREGPRRRKVTAPMALAIKLARNPEAVFSGPEIAALADIEPGNMRSGMVQGLEIGLFRIVREAGRGPGMPFLYGAGPALIRILGK